MKPVIAMPQMGHDLFREYMKSKYVRCLRRAGAKVRWIGLEDLDACISALMECDGLLLPGGADIAPGLYGQEPQEKCGKPNVLRDKGEWKMLEAFLPTSKPIFCICRGAQMLNVFCGGTLHQHIPDHSDFRSRSKGFHKATVFPNTTLAGCVGRQELFVNSLHHQAVDQLGKDLTISAVSENGIVEAVEISHHPFCLGVQWHPEHLGRHPEQQQLFDVFVAMCREDMLHL